MFINGLIPELTNLLFSNKKAAIFYVHGFQLLLDEPLQKTESVTSNQESIRLIIQSD
jgi:hypothetical protein